MPLPDVMGCCDSSWVSDYHFKRALFGRQRRETPPGPCCCGAASTKATAHTSNLRSWWMAVAVLPDSAGGYVLESLDAGERVLFSLSFPMSAIADAEEAAGGFAYTLPVRPGWEALASVTLTAPDGRTASLDGSTDRPMSILRTLARAGSGRFSAVPGRRSRRTAVAVGSRPPWARWRLRAGGCPLRDAWRR